MTKFIVSFEPDVSSLFYQHDQIVIRREIALLGAGCFATETPLHGFSIEVDDIPFPLLSYISVSVFCQYASVFVLQYVSVTVAPFQIDVSHVGQSLVFVVDSPEVNGMSETAEENDQRFHRPEG